MKRKGWLIGGIVSALVLSGTCCFGNLLLGRINVFPGGYWEGPGSKYPITENQVVQAEFSFDLPASASDVRLALHGGKDYGVSGWMLADAHEVETVLVASGYEAGGQVGFRAWTDLYPEMKWMVLADSEVQTSYSHPDHDGRVVISTRQNAGGQVEVFFQRWAGKRSSVTWQYFE